MYGLNINMVVVTENSVVAQDFSNITITSEYHAEFLGFTHGGYPGALVKTRTGEIKLIDIRYCRFTPKVFKFTKRRGK